MPETAVAEASPPAAPTAQTKAPKKKAPARDKAAGPRLGEQIDQIVADCPDKRGMSGTAIKKALTARGVDVAKRSALIKLIIKRKLEKCSLLQTRGVGFSGTFKAAEEKRSVKLVKKSKKPAPKKPAAKKSPTKKSGAKKMGAKKSLTKKPAAKNAAAKKPAAKKATLKKAKSHNKVATPKAKKSVKAKPKPKAAKPKKAASKKK